MVDNHRKQDSLVSGKKLRVTLDFRIVFYKRLAMAIRKHWLGVNAGARVLV